MPWHGQMMGWMTLWWLLGLALVVVLIWALGRTIPLGPSGGAGEPPEQLLKRRYARGEVDRETYERMLDDLRK